MFSIKREPEPSELKQTNKQFKSEIKELSIKKSYEHYKKNKTRLKYNTEETKKLFAKMNFLRCTFCDQVIHDFYDAMTVEHIELKSSNPDKIYEWTNLLCSCKTCNTKRSTKKYNNNLYLDPTKITGIERYFKFEFDGQVKPNDNLNKNDIAKADYMIKLYKLNREQLIYDRRQFIFDLLNDEFYNCISEKNKDNKHIIFLSLFTYYKKEVKNSEE